MDKIIKVELVDKKNTGTNTIFKYIRNHPTISLPFLTVAIFLSAYCNKWGYFKFFGISPSYINFNFTQLIPYINPFNLIKLLVIGAIFYLFLSLASKHAESCKKTLTTSEKMKDKYPSLMNSEAPSIKLWEIYFREYPFYCFYFLCLVFGSLWGLYKLFFLQGNNAFIFAVSYGFIFISIFFFLILARLYMVTILSIILLISLISFNFGYLKAKSEHKFDIVTISEEQHLIIDYFDDKYITISMDEYNKCKDRRNKTCNFSIHNITNAPLENVINQQKLSQVQ